LGKLGGVEIDLIEEDYLEVAEPRGIDTGHEDIQIFADSSELEIRESGEDRACLRRRSLTFRIRVRLGGLESEGKCFETGQRGEAGDHHLGWEVPRLRDAMKVKIDEVNGGRK
jgi:hypothetical protein